MKIINLNINKIPKKALSLTCASVMACSLTGCVNNDEDIKEKLITNVISGIGGVSIICTYAVIDNKIKTKK